MKRSIKITALFTFALLALTGCGKVGGPFSPLINPPIQFAFDSGSEVSGWVYDYSSNGSNQVLISSPPTPFFVTQPVFQGTGAMEVDIPMGNGTTSLTSYSIHYQFASPQDMTDKTFSCWVYLKSGLVSAPTQVGAQEFIKDSVNFRYANGTFANLVPNQWVQVLYNINAPNYSDNPAPDKTSIIQVGLQISGAGSVSFTSPGVVIADSFAY